MKKIKKYMMAAIFFLTVFAAGCGSSDKSASPVMAERYYQPQTKEDTETADTGEESKDADASSMLSELYLIEQNDMAAEQFVLRQLASGREYLFFYSLSTSFRDKYGNQCSGMEFEAGRVIYIGKRDSVGRLMEAQIADEVWEYPNITKYSIDVERGVLKIADSKYSVDSNTYVESDGLQIGLADINAKDEIRVVGMDKKIISISVTTGQGQLQLENTELFEGSFIQVGEKIFAMVTKDMLLDIPEGTYTVTVANNGYGGSQEVTIERGQTTLLNLEELKGEGPKTGQILFLLNTEEAELKIDGEVKDYSQPVELTYGIHRITVKAEGYEDYDKKLFVNSAAANIDITLTETDDSSDDTAEDSETSEETEAVESTQEKEAETGDTESRDTQSTETEKSTEDSTDTDVTTDYLSTLSNILSSLT